MRARLFEQKLTRVRKAFAIIMLSTFMATGIISCSNNKSLLVTEIKVSPPSRRIAKASKAGDFYIQGQSQHVKGDSQAAIASFTQAISLNPNYAEAYNNRGNARSVMKDINGAIDDFDQAILLDSRYAIAYNNRGNARAANGDPQAAIADYNEAIRLNPNFAPAYNNRGNARAANNDKQGAIADLQRAATIFERENNRQLYQEVMNNLKELGQ